MGKRLMPLLKCLFRQAGFKIIKDSLKGYSYGHAGHSPAHETLSILRGGELLQCIKHLLLINAR